MLANRLMLGTSRVLEAPFTLLLLLLLLLLLSLAMQVPRTVRNFA
jgi:hypothetical protein